MDWFLLFKHPLGDEHNEERHYLVDSFISEAKANEVCNKKNNDPKNNGYKFYVLEGKSQNTNER